MFMDKFFSVVGLRGRCALLVHTTNFNQLSWSHLNDSLNIQCQRWESRCRRCGTMIMAHRKANSSDTKRAIRMNLRKFLWELIAFWVAYAEIRNATDCHPVRERAWFSDCIFCTFDARCVCVSFASDKNFSRHKIIQLFIVFAIQNTGRHCQHITCSGRIPASIFVFLVDFTFLFQWFSTYLAT